LTEKSALHEVDTQEDSDAVRKREKQEKKKTLWSRKLQSLGLRGRESFVEEFFEIAKASQSRWLRSCENLFVTRAL